MYVSVLFKYVFMGHLKENIAPIWPQLIEEPKNEYDIIEWELSFW